MGLYANRQLLRDLINRNFYMEKDNGDLLERYAIYQENVDEFNLIRRNNTLSKVSPNSI